MTRLNLVLLIAVMASALYLVRTQYESRRLFAEIEKTLADARRLAIEHERLQVEKREQATPLRVETLAKERLQMRLASPAITQYVSARELSAAAPMQGASAPSAQAKLAARVGAALP